MISNDNVWLRAETSLISCKNVEIKNFEGMIIVKFWNPSPEFECFLE